MLRKYLSKYKLVTVAIVISLLSMAVVFQLASANFSELLQVRKQALVAINGQLIQAGVASSPETRYRGLSGVTSICETCGLLFVFPDSQERFFVMRDMLFPIDIVFIEGGVVSHVESNLQPDPPGTNEQSRPLYASQGRADRVLELPAGYASKNQIKRGDQISMTIYEY